MIKYPAKIVREEDGKYSVFFLGDGMDGCMTFGMSLDDAKKNAQEALDLYIEYLYSEKRRIPIPSTHTLRKTASISDSLSISPSHLRKYSQRHSHTGKASSRTGREAVSSPS